MEKTFKVTLADGTVLDNLGLNGNNYISKKKIEASAFEGKLSHVEVYDYEDEKTTVLEDQVLVQCVKYDKEYWFILRGKTTEERLAEDNEILAGAIEELAAIIGEL